MTNEHIEEEIRALNEFNRKIAEKKVDSIPVGLLQLLKPWIYLKYGVLGGEKIKINENDRAVLEMKEGQIKRDLIEKIAGGDEMTFTQTLRKNGIDNEIIREEIFRRFSQNGDFDQYELSFPSTF